jgi:hypothetical protein
MIVTFHSIINDYCINLYDIGGKARRKEPLGRPRRRWVENIKRDIQEIALD